MEKANSGRNVNAFSKPVRLYFIQYMQHHNPQKVPKNMYLVQR